MKITKSEILGLMPVYDLSVDHPDHSFLLDSGVVAHNCAYIISDRPIKEFIPLTEVGGHTVTQYTAGGCEQVGAIKMDFLSVNSLEDISCAIRMIQKKWVEKGYKGFKRHEEIHDEQIDGIRVPGLRIIPHPDTGEPIDIWELPDDQRVFNQICEGKTETVFQFNTSGAVKWLKHFNYLNGKETDGVKHKSIDSLEGMTAFTSLDRPGPLDANVKDEDGEEHHNMLVEYARRARGEAAIGNLSVFDDNLPETFGVMCYQEQLQKMYQILTGCTGAEAEGFRRAVAKKKMAVVNKAYPFFIEKASEKLGKEVAEDVWSFLKTWAQYGFNKTMLKDSVLYSPGNGYKLIREFKKGDLVLGVDDNGELIEDEVVALHDHGDLQGFEIQFDDGNTEVCSIHHKFLTEFGQKPLWQILMNDWSILCHAKEAGRRLEESLWGSGEKPSGDVEPSEDLLGVQGPKTKEVSGQVRKGNSGVSPANRTPCQLSSVRRGEAGNGRRANAETERTFGSGSALRGNLSEETVGEAQKVLCKMPGNQSQKHPGQDEQAQPEPGTEKGGVRHCQEDLCSQEHTTPESGKVEGLEGQEQGAMAEEFEPWTDLSQEFQDGGLVERKFAARLGRAKGQVRRRSEVGRLRIGENVGRGRRLLSLLLSEKRQEKPATNSAGQGRDVEQGSGKERGNSDSIVHAMFSYFHGCSETGMDELAFSDAPLSSTGDLVPRKLVRIRPMGEQRMYDLEVAHPKHNFLLSNGVVTSNSHALCYSAIGYACAYLKYHHPLEWWCAVLQNAKKNEIADTFWRYCGNFVKMPDINLSGDNFEIIDDSIRSPISMMQGIGAKAHEQICQYRPYEDIYDFCEKVQRYKKENATTRVNKKGETVPKLAVSALNRGVCTKLILSGCMDSLFPEDTTVLEKLAMYEEATAKVAGKRKVQPVDPRYSLVSPMELFQIRKQILPQHYENLWKMIIPHIKDRLMKNPHGRLTYLGSRKYDYPLARMDEIEILDQVSPLPPDGVRVSCAAYITDQRVFSFQGGQKSACEFAIEIDGVSKSFVKWGEFKTGKLHSAYKKDMKGALAMVCMRKSKEGRPFSIDRIDVIQAPLSEESK